MYWQQTPIIIEPLLKLQISPDVKNHFLDVCISLLVILPYYSPLKLLKNIFLWTKHPCFGATGCLVPGDGDAPQFWTAATAVAANVDGALSGRGRNEVLRKMQSPPARKVPDLQVGDDSG